MTRLRVLFCMGVGLLLSTGWLAGQEAKQEAKQETKKEAVPIRGQLPPYWKQLGLSKEQVQTVYKIQADYGGKVSELSQKIDKLKSQQKADMEKVLTPAQKERLREIIAGKAPTETKKP